MSDGGATLPAMRIAVLVFAIATLGACRRGPTCDASDPISLELCGPRKEWVGQWIGEDDRSRSIDIGAHGGYRFRDTNPHHARRVEGDIVAFAGHDLRVRITDATADDLRVAINAAPHDDHGTWRMTVDGHPYYRSAP